jgi:hypothetical protein
MQLGLSQCCCMKHKVPQATQAASRWTSTALRPLCPCAVHGTNAHSRVATPVGSLVAAWGVSVCEGPSLTVSWNEGRPQLLLSQKDCPGLRVISEADPYFICPSLCACI